VATPEIKEKLDSQGMDPFISTPDQFAAQMRADMAKFASIIKTANIKIEN
jgi:tripartite-type tricarboxylate transporter receptor subunit TctC